MHRIILIVLDSVGIGALPDADKFGDVGTNTVGHIAQRIPSMRLPHLAALGLGNIRPDLGIPAAETPMGSFGQAMEVSPGKDTTTGHWEISGVILKKDWPYYPQGFPADLMAEFEKQIGRKTLCNHTGSGTDIIDQYGEEHQRTGRPIVYTSADSVFQIAMHEETISLEEQYRICQIARNLLIGEHEVSRVIARPFLGAPGSYQRTANRRDFSITPPGKTILDLAREKGLETMAVGKIKDIFAGHGVSQHCKTANNMEGVDRTLEFIRSGTPGLIFTNLVDFDQNHGHRRDPVGYANCLMEFDARLPELLASLQPRDILILTADHGNDPTHTGSDHTREHIPILMAGAPVRKGAHVGTRKTFADIGQTVAELLGLSPTEDGSSFAQDILV
jgi:phosphopentomutase